MRILTRYILREVTSYALLGGALFTFVLFMRDLGRILDLVVRESASLGQVFLVFAYTLPSAITYTIPMAVLVGILLGLSRLASDSEITAMRASGMGALSFVRIVSIVASVALAVGLFNSLYLAPRAASGLLRLGDSLKSSQASFEVQPRVFYEEFRNYVLYIQDVQPAAGAALWHHVFLADLTQPATPHITTADRAVVVSGTPGTADAQTIRLHLIDGGQHETSASNPNQYDISTFASTDIPIETEAPSDAHLGRADTPILALPLHELWRRASLSGTPENVSRAYRIEFQKRFSYPFACLVLMLVGVPLGLSSKRGGKSTGFVLTILLVFIYYFISSVGVAFAKNGRLSPFLGVWGANLLFTGAGAILLYQMSRGSITLGVFSSIGTYVNKTYTRLTSRGEKESIASGLSPDAATVLRRFRRTFRIQFPLLLDDYVMREYATNFALILASFSALSIIFTFFELVGDIFRNRTPLFTVGDYLLNLIPFMLYNVTPLCALVAVLVTFGALSRSSEITAMKATGVSLYRIITPVLIVTLLISACLFAFDELYLPAANRRQEALLSVIKDKPAQTFLRPDRKWISGQTTASGEPSRIFYYQFFDADKNVFANLSVFEFEPSTFALQRRIFAASARWDPRVNRWVFDDGWQRTFAGETVASYQPFAVATFPEIREQPSYFKKEDIPSQEMSYGELSRYISDLKQSGFDTTRLSVQLNRKIAYPLITLVMAILAVPFSLSMGKKGSLAGIATAIGLAVAYWVVAGLFEAMGNVNTLPPLLAAWSPDLLFGIAGTYLLLRTPNLVEEIRYTNGSAIRLPTHPKHHFEATVVTPVEAMPPTLSVAIITLNEEANLARTLASVQFADEVILVDSGSTDRTLEIARSFANTTIFSEDWKGFSAQKNSAIEKCTGTWVLSLDADEELSPELQTEIRILLSRKPSADAWLLRRRNLFLNRWIRHGGYYPDPKLRLFRRHAANFASPARFTERPVHETITFEGRLETLHHDLIHHAYPTIESYIEHMDRYSTLGAQIVVSKGKTSRSWLAFHSNILLIPTFTFIWNYIFRLGFLDGREGLLLHIYHSTYTSWKYAKAWQTTREHQNISVPLAASEKRVPRL